MQTSWARSGVAVFGRHKTDGPRGHEMSWLHGRNPRRAVAIPCDRTRRRPIRVVSKLPMQSGVNLVSRPTRVRGCIRR